MSNIKIAVGGLEHETAGFLDGNTKLAISSVNKQKLGQFCSFIRSKSTTSSVTGCSTCILVFISMK